MNKLLKIFLFSIFIFALIIIMPKQNYAQSTLICTSCHVTSHVTNDSLWVTSHHGNTQNDVASELSSEDIGSTPSAVVSGEDCIACHAPTAVTVNGGMTEAQALGNFFSTTNGVFTDSTHAIDTTNWPNVACVACHNVPSDHPTSLPVLAIYNSFSAQYASVANSTELCGQCHGSLRFSDTDHLTMNAWKTSKHGHGGQADVASELSTEDVGKTPAEVIADENCIACHAPASVMNNNLTEADALGNFFTTTDGKFTSSTAPQDTSNYPQVACVTCHNPHKPGVRSYFNSSTKKYEVMSSAQELCGQCHGNLRFADTDHLSYNIEKGTGGQGIANKVTMPGVQCVNCHMHVGTVDDSNSAMFRGHTWKIFVKEADGSVSASCTVCHSTMTASAATDTINSWKAEFVKLDSTANDKVNKAAAKLANSTDSTKIKLLAEAQFNLTYAESDESGGVHNHLYTQALVKDAINKADQIITGITGNLTPIAKEFKLYQNYPNPFNPSTNIEYTLPNAANVKIEVFNITGQKIKTLINRYENAGLHSVKFDAADLPSGIYFYRLISGQFENTKKMILLR